MTINNPSILSHNAPVMLGSVDSVDLNAVAATTLYTVPTGKKCVLNFVRLRNISADCASAVVTVGQVGALTDFLGSQTLSNLNAAASTAILMPVPNATSVKGIEYTAGEVLQINVATAAGSGCTATVELFGTLDDA
ncbi:MAG: hypothetical protein ACYS80_26300 [Planctomycetota bacterium]|jgi:hypothetical protein